MTPEPRSSSASSAQRDQALVEAVRRKDRKATAEFVRLYADAVFAYVRARVRPNEADADDLAQEVFLAAYQHMDGYRGESSLRAWILGIARHKVEDYYRARVHVSELEDAGVIVAGDLQLDAALDEHRTRERAMAVLDRLPESDRVLLKWRYWDGKRTAQIAAALGRTDKAVERMLARAREHFRRHWLERQP